MYFASATLIPAVVSIALFAASPASGQECRSARELWPAGASAAESRARSCLDESPGNPERLVALSQILAWQERHREALAWAEIARVYAPEDLDVQAWRLRLLGWLSRFDDADATLESLPAAPEHRELALVRADLALWRTDWRGAEASYSSYLEQWPDDPGARRSLAIARLRMGDDARARPVLAGLCLEDNRNACLTVRDQGRSGTVLLLQGGPVASTGDGSGWRARAGIEGMPSDRFRLRGGVELQERSFAGESMRDTLFDGGGTLRLVSRLTLDLGAGFAVNPQFSPDWNAHAELGYGLGSGFTVYGRFWHIAFARAGVDVLSPAIVYEGSAFWASLRLWRSFDPAGDGLAVLGQAGIPLIAKFDLTLGAGAGDKADYLTVRDAAVERHVVGLAGLAWTPEYEYQLRLDYVGRREWSGDDRLMRHELLLGVARRW
ncbi:tetratricopeptide repeat protein [Vulgatibacter incomptus]|uniref:TPR repeat protein n=1 Tax=Vulgatibacter incomptus TaxID=1391653 RepID=A0A0K1PEJ1_9BACT|nr:hypothetical protein [Vulgatibacter incomptus]AKU91831.1 hypothetical protein AKJ08_2218 [Vulgatibacter incomptus]